MILLSPSLPAPGTSGTAAQPGLGQDKDFQAAPFACPQPTMNLPNPTCLGLPADIKYFLQETQLAGSRQFIELLPQTVKIYEGLHIN